MSLYKTALVCGIGMLLACSPPAAADEPVDWNVWKVGFGRADITPDRPVRMDGYSGRVEPSKGVEGRIHVKAMAVEDAAGEKAVLVTMDLAGVWDFFTDPVYQQVGEPMGIACGRFLFTCSHNHSGPDTGISRQGGELAEKVGRRAPGE